MSNHRPGHHGTTHPAGKMLPKSETVEGFSSKAFWYDMKKYHNRKSRYWFRDEIRKVMRNEKSKL